ncbi:KaiC [uncultured archaeon]|nr:KaiC [uncultured archaeon]
MLNMKSDADMLKKLGGGVVVSMPQDKKRIKVVLNEMLTHRKMLGVYLTTAQPHAKVIEWLNKEKVDASSLFMLDLAGRQEEAEENIFILRDPSDLTELSVVITEIMENDSIGFLVVDGISGLETYAESGSVKRFLHALVTYMKKINKTLIVYYTGSESKDLMSFLLQVSDIHED